MNLPGNETICNKNYMPGRRKEVNYNGKTAIVMTESDFNSIAEPLRKSLKPSNVFDTGVHFHIHQTNESDAPSYITIPWTLVREPYKLEGNDKAWVDLDDLNRCLPSNGKAAAPAGNLESVVHPSAPQGATATFVPLDAEEEA